MLNKFKVNNKDVTLACRVDFELGSRVCPKTLCKSLYHIETNPDFYMIRVFTGREFRIECNRFASLLKSA